jgi:hypothetical protein
VCGHPAEEEERGGGKGKLTMEGGFGDDGGSESDKERWRLAH